MGKVAGHVVFSATDWGLCADPTPMVYTMPSGKTLDEIFPLSVLTLFLTPQHAPMATFTPSSLTPLLPGVRCTKVAISVLGQIPGSVSVACENVFQSSLPVPLPSFKVFEAHQPYNRKVIT
jgi:hypothetical protein